MKKILIASTALVAAGLMSGTASASEKISLKLGGFSKWWVVGQWNDSKYQAENAGNKDYNNVDVKGDNEVYFGGSTTLDNGVKVGVDIQLEAGGHTDQTSDTIDESYVFIEGGFGKFIVGTKDNGAYLLHVTAPDAAGNWNEGGILTGSMAIANPGVRTITPLNSTTGNTTAVLTGGDAEKITYVAPTFYGLTVGASYVPNTSEDNRGLVDNKHQVAADIVGAGALYANTFGGVGVKVSGGYVTYSVEDAAATATASGSSSALTGKTNVNEYTTGAQLSYAGFTVGGSYRKVDPNKANATVATVNGQAWDLGVQYASGPYAVSAAYFKSSVDGTAAITAKDEIEFYQVSGKYTLGAGVDVLASVGHGKFEGEARTASVENKGWTAMTGLSLAF